MNIDDKTVSSFSEEWSRFPQENKSLIDFEAFEIFSEYFRCFPMELLTRNSVGFDMGCGTGRWAQFIAPKVGLLNCIDPSGAIHIAKDRLKIFDNIIFLQQSADTVELESNSQDFGYSLGVLHHIPDTFKAIQNCVDLLKPGAPLLLYLYYSLDNRSPMYRLVWKLTNVARLLISKMPKRLKFLITDLIALTIYMPMARASKFLEIAGIGVANIPLSYYRSHSFYTMRTDALDRFGTPLENRFSKNEIEVMLDKAGIINYIFSDKQPFWCVVGYKK